MRTCHRHLKLALALLLLVVNLRSITSAQTPKPNVTFEEVPAGKSGIIWIHTDDATLADVTDKAGVAAPGWPSCALWFDYNNDGKLKLFVTSFLVYEKSLNIFCPDQGLSRPSYCVPRLFKPRPSHLFHNDGN